MRVKTVSCPRIQYNYPGLHRGQTSEHGDGNKNKLRVRRQTSTLHRVLTDFFGKRPEKKVNQQNAGNILNFVFEKSKLLLLPMSLFPFANYYQGFDFSRKFCVTPDCCNGFPLKFCAGNWRAGDQNLRLSFASI